MSLSLNYEEYLDDGLIDSELTNHHLFQNIKEYLDAAVTRNGYDEMKLRDRITSDKWFKYKEVGPAEEKSASNLKLKRRNFPDSWLIHVKCFKVTGKRRERRRYEIDEASFQAITGLPLPPNSYIIQWMVHPQMSRNQRNQTLSTQPNPPVPRGMDYQGPPLCPVGVRPPPPPPVGAQGHGPYHGGNHGGHQVLLIGADSLQSLSNERIHMDKLNSLYNKIDQVEKQMASLSMTSLSCEHKYEKMGARDNQLEEQTSASISLPEMEGYNFSAVASSIKHPHADAGLDNAKKVKSMPVKKSVSHSQQFVLEKSRATNKGMHLRMVKRSGVTKQGMLAMKRALVSFSSEVLSLKECYRKTDIKNEMLAKQLMHLKQKYQLMVEKDGKLVGKMATCSNCSPAIDVTKPSVLLTGQEGFEFPAVVLNTANVQNGMGSSNSQQSIPMRVSLKKSASRFNQFVLKRPNCKNKGICLGMVKEMSIIKEEALAMKQAMQTLSSDIAFLMEQLLSGKKRDLQLTELEDASRSSNNQIDTRCVPEMLLTSAIPLDSSSTTPGGDLQVVETLDDAYHI